MKLKDLKPNPANPREITKERLEMLKNAIDEYGSLDGFIFNVRTKVLFGGHQRQKIDPEAKIEIKERFDPPLLDGTVARGEVLVRGHLFPYREVDWDQSKETGALLAANENAGRWDKKKLVDALLSLDQVNFDLNLTMFDEDQLAKIMAPVRRDEDLYTKKIEIPIYEPKGEKPPIESLFDRSKTLQLAAKIASAKIPDEIKGFLCLAAERHTVFNYDKLAEYYAHAPKEVQELMEKSALVIIDLDQAIENGFVAMSKEISETYGDEK